jgi:hypothetical protein
MPMFSSEEKTAGKLFWRAQLLWRRISVLIGPPILQPTNQPNVLEGLRWLFIEKKQCCESRNEITVNLIEARVIRLNDRFQWCPPTTIHRVEDFHQCILRQILY